MTITLSHKEHRLVFLFISLKASIVLGIRLNCVVLVAVPFVELVVKHVVEPQTPFLHVGLVFFILQLVCYDDSKLEVWSFGT